eukprot:7785672-Pyramimonas_sp.AAC.1
MSADVMSAHMKGCSSGVSAFAKVVNAFMRCHCFCCTCMWHGSSSMPASTSSYLTSTAGDVAADSAQATARALVLSPTCAISAILNCETAGFGCGGLCVAVAVFTATAPQS